MRAFDLEHFAISFKPPSLEFIAIALIDNDSTSLSQFNPTFATWYGINQLIMNWLISFI